MQYKPLGLTFLDGRTTFGGLVCERHEDPLDPLRDGLLRPSGSDYEQDGLANFCFGDSYFPKFTR